MEQNIEEFREMLRSFINKTENAFRSSKSSTLDIQATVDLRV